MAMQANLCRRFMPDIHQRVFQCLSVSQRSLHLGEHFTRGSLAEIELTTPVPLAGRKYLASSRSAGFPKFLSGPRENYPLLVKAKNGQGRTLGHWAKRARDVIDEAYRRFDDDGTAVAILFRDLPINNATDYSQWVNTLGFEPFAYVGGVSWRNEIETNVAEGALDPKELTIEPHNEMAYMVNHPKIFAICCLQQATRGGETAICDVREILAKLDANFVEKCAEKGIRYTHFLNDKNKEGRFYKSWQEQFLTEDPSKVELLLKERDYTFEWKGSDLFYWINKPPFITDPRNGEQLWFNSMATLHYSFFRDYPNLIDGNLPANEYVTHSMYGDGVEFEQDRIDELRRITWENAVGFQWQSGDVLFLDQLIVQHSKLGFEGNREVGVSLFTY